MLNYFGGNFYWDYQYKMKIIYIEITNISVYLIYLKNSIYLRDK